MKILTTIAIIILLACPVDAQNISSKQPAATPEFKNQGEQEDYWAVPLFKNNYQKQNLQKFTGKITVLPDHQIMYDSTLLKAYVDPPELAVFTSGLFYPGLTVRSAQPEVMVNGKKVSHVKLKGKHSGSSFTTEQLKKLNSISYSNFEEIKFLSNSPQVKRFRYLVHNELMPNPQVCFLELTNERATEDTTLEDFINGAKLTFLINGWVEI